MFFQLSWAPVHLGNHNSHGPAETSGKSLSFFFFIFLGEVLERPIPLKNVRLVRMENKTIGKLSMRIQEVLIGAEGLTEGFQGAGTRGVYGIRKEVSERIQMDGFPRECG